MHNENFVLLYDGEHYNLAYENDYISSKPILLHYDRSYQEILEKYASVFGKCEICHKNIQSEIDFSFHKCSNLHVHCLNEWLLHISKGKILYTDEEINTDPLRQCPICKYIFTNEDLSNLFDKTSYEIFNEEKNKRLQLENDNKFARQQQQKIVEEEKILLTNTKKSPIKQEINCAICEAKSGFLFVHACQFAMHPECLLNSWNEICEKIFGKGTKIQLLSMQEKLRMEKEFKCIFCEQKLSEEDIEKIINSKPKIQENSFIKTPMSSYIPKPAFIPKITPFEKKTLERNSKFLPIPNKFMPNNTNNRPIRQTQIVDRAESVHYKPFQKFETSPSPNNFKQGPEPLKSKISQRSPSNIPGISRENKLNQNNEWITNYAKGATKRENKLSSHSFHENNLQNSVRIVGNSKDNLQIALEFTNKHWNKIISSIILIIASLMIYWIGKGKLW